MADNNCEFVVDETIFSLPVILKSVNWLTNEYLFFIERIDESRIKVRLELINSDSKIDIEAIRVKINQYMIDFKVREIVHSETKNIKEMIIVKAFSNIPDFNEGLIESTE